MSNEQPYEHLFHLMPGHRLPQVSHGKGIYLYDVDGNRYIDGSSGAIVAALGHGDPRMVKVMADQAGRAAFTYRTQFVNQPALDLAERLAALTPGDLTEVFYVSGGSEAVETAIKMAHQYHKRLGDHGRWKVVTRNPSYHGATIGALSATSYTSITQPFNHLRFGWPKVSMPNVYRSPYGSDPEVVAERSANEVEEAILREGPENIAAFLFEPIGGASPGAVVPPDGYYDLVWQICRRYGILLIADEVLTGFGRTGKWFACNHWELEPDIMTLSKGMGAGYTPLGAVIATHEVAATVKKDGTDFIHGFTYAGNPLSCAIGLQVIDILEADQLVERSETVGAHLRKRLEELRERVSCIGDVRGQGLLQGVELVADVESKEPYPPEWNAAVSVAELAMAHGLIIYPRRSIDGRLGDHFLVAPPLIITESQVDELVSILENVLVEWESRNFTLGEAVAR